MEGSISQSLIHPIRPLKWPDLNGEFSLASDKTGGSEWLDGWMFGWALCKGLKANMTDRRALGVGWE